MNLWLEMEIGITGGEQDVVDNSGVKVNSPSQSRWIFTVKSYQIFQPFLYPGVQGSHPSWHLTMCMECKRQQRRPVPTPAGGDPGVSQAAAA